MCLVIEAIGINHLLSDGEDPPVQSFLVHPAEPRLVAFLRVHAHFLLSAFSFISVILHPMQVCYNTFHSRVKWELRES
jgi:hypothetical protein